MTSPHFSNFLTPLPPLVTPVMPWKSPQIAIFCTPLPLSLRWRNLWMTPNAKLELQCKSTLFQMCSLFLQNIADRTMGKIFLFLAILLINSTYVRILKTWIYLLEFWEPTVSHACPSVAETFIFILKWAIYKFAKSNYLFDWHFC